MIPVMPLSLLSTTPPYNPIHPYLLSVTKLICKGSPSQRLVGVWLESKLMHESDRASERERERERETKSALRPETEKEREKDKAVFACQRPSDSSIGFPFGGGEVALSSSYDILQ